jgi:hypothetical protein
MFVASENNIRGGIPLVISNLSRLALIDLCNNVLTGTIPESITLMENVVLLDISSNKISGRIQRDISTCLGVTGRKKGFSPGW